MTTEGNLGAVLNSQSNRQEEVINEEEPYEMPELIRIIEAVQGSKILSVIDLKDGYFQVEIEEGDKYKTAFEFEGKAYEWNGMVMGFKNAPATFQRIMNKVLEDVTDKGVKVYLDDIVVYGKTKQEHDQLIRKVFKLLQDNNFVVNMDKMQFSMNKVKLLGMEVDGTNQTPERIKKQEALNYPRPTCKIALRRFLGKMNYYRGFIKKFAEITEALYEALKEERQWYWNENMERAFVRVKEELLKVKKLKLPEYNKEFILETDASNTGLGAVLLQRDESGRMVPVKWGSRKLSPTEKRYGITEKEMLAVLWGVTNFDYELRGRKFHLVSDHKALKYIWETGESNNSRINRWLVKLQEYNFTIEYRKDELMDSADALSRLYEKDKVEQETGAEENNEKYNQFIVERNGKHFFK